MKFARIFSNTDTAYAELLQALNQKNWQDYFLTNRNSNKIDIFMSKDAVRNCNDIVPLGGFFNEMQAEKLLHGLLTEYAMEIAEWLVHGNLAPLIIRHTYIEEPAGYSFDKNSCEQPEYKVRLTLRKELLINGLQHNVTKLGIFVSTFAPVARF